MSAWKPKCWYAGSSKCFGEGCLESDERAAHSGHPEGMQGDPSECKWIKNWIYCPYI